MAERPEDLNLPNSIVARIIKESLPEGVNVSKEARTAIAKAASVFVLYATSCSNNIAMKANRKTISGADVLSAMSDMEFDRFTEPLQQSLEGQFHILILVVHFKVYQHTCLILNYFFLYCTPLTAYKKTQKDKKEAIAKKKQEKTDKKETSIGEEGDAIMEETGENGKENDEEDQGEEEEQENEEADEQNLK